MQNIDPEEVALYLASIRGERAHLRDLKRQYSGLTNLQLTKWEYQNAAKELRQEIQTSEERIAKSIEWLKAAGVL